MIPALAAAATPASEKPLSEKLQNFFTHSASTLDLDRITSYNVCYTKLLRTCALPARVSAQAWPINAWASQALASSQAP